jgi:hypothetical protein
MYVVYERILQLLGKKKLYRTTTNYYVKKCVILYFISEMRNTR